MPRQSLRGLTLGSALGLEKARLVALCGGGGKTSLMFALGDEWLRAGDRVLLTTTTHIAAAQAEGHEAWVGADAQALIARARRSDAPLVVATAGPAHDPEKLRGLAPAEVDALARDGCFTRIVVEADGSKHRPLKAPAGHEPAFPESAQAVVMVAGLAGLGKPLSDDTVFRVERWSRITGAMPGDIVTPRALAQVVLHGQGLAQGAPACAKRVLLLNQADDDERVDKAEEVYDLLGRLSGRRPDRVVIARLKPDVSVVRVLCCRYDNRGEERP